MTSHRIGVLAEDGTDCATLEVLIKRMLGARVGAGIGIKKLSGKGCAQLRGKAKAWLGELDRAKCTAAILLHDLDQRTEDELRKQLQTIPVPGGMRLLICIPIEELEAWFWSDPEIVFKITGSRKTISAPERIRSPKEEFMRQSRLLHQKSRYQTNMNPELARDLDLNLCAQRCRAFRELRDFVGALGH